MEFSRFGISQTLFRGAAFCEQPALIRGSEAGIRNARLCDSPGENRAVKVVAAKRRIAARREHLENTPVKLLSYKGNVFSVETPNFVELTVTKADPGVKGDTATNVTKPATVETGAEIKVPLFINEGEKIQIDTRTGEYLGRVKG